MLSGIGALGQHNDPSNCSFSALDVVVAHLPTSPMNNENGSNTVFSLAENVARMDLGYYIYVSRYVGVITYIFLGLFFTVNHLFAGLSSRFTVHIAMCHRNY